MPGIIESATAILNANEGRLETIANNVSNLTTPGFKRQLSFVELVADSQSGGLAVPMPRVRSDLAQGRMQATANSLDLAISGEGLFQLRAGQGFVYSRQGHFRLAEDGTVVSTQGYALQQAGGGDLVLDRAAVEILADGTVLDDGRPIARIALFEPANENALQPLAGSLFVNAGEAMNEVDRPELRQGMLETSNVSLGDEMAATMATLRQAESGGRLVQLYDDLVGRAISTLGQGGQ